MRSVKNQNGDNSLTGYLVGFANRLYLPIEYTPAKKLNNAWLILIPK